MSGRVSIDIERNLLASRLTDLAMMWPLDGYLAEIACTHALVIRIASPEDPLAVELTQCFGVGVGDSKQPKVLEFHTQIARTEDQPTIPPASPGDGSGGIEIDALRRFALGGLCFAAPLSKRSVGTMTEHVTVGRALNKDLVLRAQGVSKLHAWFELSGDTIAVCDAGSKNGSFVGGRRIPAREPVTIPPGERIAFSNIEALPCTARAFWQFLR